METIGIIGIVQELFKIMEKKMETIGIIGIIQKL